VGRAVSADAGRRGGVRQPLARVASDRSRGEWPDVNSPDRANAVADPRRARGRPRRFVVDPEPAEHCGKRVLAHGGIELDRRVQRIDDADFPAPLATAVFECALLGFVFSQPCERHRNARYGL